VERATDTIVGSRPRTAGRSPRTFSENRTCAEETCNTRLNRYNRFDRCSQHQRIRFPRVRGRNPVE
jgi:hypothetical protein